MSGSNPLGESRQPAAERHTSGLTSRLILTYVEREAGRAGVEAVLDRCGLLRDEERLRDVTHWFDFETKVALFGAAADVLNQPDVAWRIGREAVDLHTMSGYKVALRAFGTPRLAYAALPGTTGRLTRAHRLELIDLDDAFARFRYVDAAGVGYDKTDCEYTAGMLSCVPTLFGQLHAYVGHSACALRGADACVYEVQWERHPSMRNWVAAGAVAAAGGALLARSTRARRVVPAPVVGAAVAAHGAMLAQRRRRRSLEAELRDQKDAAQDLSASLHDLVSDLRTEEVLRKIIEHAQSALVGREIAVLVLSGGHVRGQGSPGLPDSATDALQRWVAASPHVLEHPVTLPDLAESPALEAIASDPNTPLGALSSAPLVFRGGRLGVIVALAHGADTFLPREVAQLEVYAAEAAIALANARLVERLEGLTRVDSLTGLLNHREFQETLGRELEAAQRSRNPLSVVMLDLDGFKRVNDEYGHAEGDRVITLVADTIRRACGPGDGAARIGGDEFGLVLPGRTEEQAQALATEIAQGVAALGLDTSASWGVAEWPTAGPSQSLLLFNADRALYEHKAAARNEHGRAPAETNGAAETNGTAPELGTPAQHRKGLTAALARAVDAKDSYTRSHCDTVAGLCGLVAEELGFEPRRVLKVRLAGLLHDVGKIGIADAILQKPGKLTDEEFEIMKSHAPLGHSILYAAELFDESYWVLHHHERIDGRGYPDGLEGDAIPIESRIILVADAFEAMTSDRPYRRGREESEALAELEAHSGTQFDPDCVRALIRVLHREAFWLSEVAPGSDADPLLGPKSSSKVTNE